MLKQGIYEQIINEKLKKNLQGMSSDAFEIGKESIDVEEARKVLYFSFNVLIMSLQVLI